MHANMLRNMNRHRRTQATTFYSNRAYKSYPLNGCTIYNGAVYGAYFTVDPPIDYVDWPELRALSTRHTTSMTLGRRRPCALLLLLAAPELLAFDADSARRPAAPTGARSGAPGLQGVTSAPVAGVSRPAVQQQGGVAGLRSEVSKWYAMYQGFVGGCAKVSRFINMGCGVWLVFSTPFALIGSTFGLRPSEVLLCVYLCGMGALMFAIEVPLGALQRVVKQYFFFVFTRTGRAAFVVLVASIASIIKHIGMVTKALLVFNAGLNFYILNSQDRRFAAVDAQAKQALDAVGAELRQSASGALSMGKYLGLGKMFGGEPAPAPAAPGGGFDDGSSAGSFQPPEPAAPTWPGGGDA